jgi:hypothetical protein
MSLSSRTKALRVFIVVPVLAVILLVGARHYGAYRWNAGTQELRARLVETRVPIRPRTVDLCELESLPAPVHRYLRVALEEGQPMAGGVHVQYRGTFTMDETTDQWKPFASNQKVVGRRPGFDWDGRIAMIPGLPVRVHDACVASADVLHAFREPLFHTLG